MSASKFPVLARITLTSWAGLGGERQRRTAQLCSSLPPGTLNNRGGEPKSQTGQGGRKVTGFMRQVPSCRTRHVQAASPATRARRLPESLYRTTQHTPAIAWPGVLAGFVLQGASAASGRSPEDVQPCLDRWIATT